MFHVDTSIAIEHYQHPKQDAPNLAVRVLLQTTPDNSGEALAVSVSEAGFLVIQRAKFGSAILSADGQARFELLDTVTLRLDVLAKLIMDEARETSDERERDRTALVLV